MSSMTSVLFGGDNSSPSTSATSWNRINATYPSSWSTSSDTVRATPVGGAFTLTNFYIQIDVAPTTGNSFTFTVVKNGTATAMQVVISDLATSGTDTTNSVSVVAGDTLSLQCTPSGAAPVTSTAQSWNFVVTAPSLTAPLLSSLASASTTVTNYASLTAGHVSSSGWSATETDSQIIVPTAGTINNLYVKLSNTPGSTKSFQFTLVQNGSTTTLDATVSGTGTTASDTTHSVSVAAGDTLTMRSVPTNTPNTPTSIAFGMVFTPTNPGESFFGFGSSVAPSALATAYEQVLGLGNIAWTAAESGRILVPGPCTLKKVYVKLGTAPGGIATRTFALRKAGATSGLTVTISGASTTGNTAADVTYAQGDTIAYISTVSGSPAADTGGVHIGVLLYATPTITTDQSSLLLLGMS
jgi:hypothetical protein